MYVWHVMCVYVHRSYMLINYRCQWIYTQPGWREVRPLR